MVPSIWVRGRQPRSAGSRRPSPSAPPLSVSGLVIEVTEQTFNVDVVDRSRTTPVIIDLWAEWCGPCKQLSPVLEKLAAEADGQWILAKVDVDANPQLAAALQVQSIPMVVAVIGGQMVDGFLGALPEAQVRQWLGQVLGMRQRSWACRSPAARPARPGTGTPRTRTPRTATLRKGRGARWRRKPAEQPCGYGDASAMPPAYVEARAAMERGDLDAAAKAFEDQLAASPSDPVAKTGLSQVNLIRRVSSYDQARVRRDAAEHPADAEAQIRVADLDMASGRSEDAFDRLLGVIRRTSGEDRDKARVHLVGLFEILPPRDRRVAKARSALSALLF